MSHPQIKGPRPVPAGRSAKMTSMVTGFNTDVEHEGRVYHVQTEDKGTDNPTIETLVYRGGEILAARRSYADLKASGWGEAVIAGRIEEQHNQVIADVRAGRFEPPASPGVREGIVTTGASTGGARLPALGDGPRPARDLIGDRAVDPSSRAPAGSRCWSPGPTAGTASGPRRGSHQADHHLPAVRRRSPRARAPTPPAGPPSRSPFRPSRARRRGTGRSGHGGKDSAETRRAVEPAARAARPRLRPHRCPDPCSTAVRTGRRLLAPRFGVCSRR